MELVRKPSVDLRQTRRHCKQTSKKKVWLLIFKGLMTKPQTSYQVKFNYLKAKEMVLPCRSVANCTFDFKDLVRLRWFILDLRSI